MYLPILHIPGVILHIPRKIAPCDRALSAYLITEGLSQFISGKKLKIHRMEIVWTFIASRIDFDFSYHPNIHIIAFGKSIV